MCQDCQTYSQARTILVNNDPTRTTTLRNVFVRDMDRRFNELTRAITMAIVDQDVFGLNTIITQQVTIPPQGAFAFPTNGAKMEGFMLWLEEQIRRGILEVNDFGPIGGTPWTNKYVTDSYKRGVIRARSEMQKAGFNVPSIEATGGIEITLQAPVHVNQLSLLYTRVFSELKGITAAMEQQIGRVLAQGLADGDNPRLLARKLVAVINGTGMGELGITDTLGRYIPARRRAEILARTEIIRSHHIGTMQEYKNWGVLGVNVKAEFVTAQDNRVCPDCEALEGNIFTLEQAWNLIPVHPQCRCIMLPVKT